MTPDRASGAKKKASAMLPREHGAYAQLGFPLLTALLLGGVSPAALLLIVSTIAFFLAHEPVLVLIGGRGGRARRETGAQARRRAALLLAIAIPAGALGLWLAPTDARLAALVPVALGVLFAPLVVLRREKTAAGELLVAFTLPSALLPVALASGVAFQPASVAFLVWAVAFSLGTLTVRGIIGRAKRGRQPGWPAYVAPILSLLAIAASITLALRGALPALAAVAVIPTALVAFVFGMLGVHPRNLRRMGWSLVASNVAVLAALILGLR